MKELRNYGLEHVSQAFHQLIDENDEIMQSKGSLKK